MGRGRKRRLPEVTLDVFTELPETDGISLESCGSKAEHAGGDVLPLGKEQASENQENDSEIRDVDREKPDGIEENGMEIDGYVEEIGGGVIDNKLLIKIGEEKAVEIEEKGKEISEKAVKNCSSGEDGGSGLGKKRGRKPKKKDERLQVQDVDCGTVVQSREKVEKLEEGSPLNGLTMKEKGEVEGAGAKYIRRTVRKKGNRTGGKVTERGKEDGEELQDSSGKEKNGSHGEKWDNEGRLGLNGKKEATFTENQEEKAQESEILGKLVLKNNVFLKQEEECITPGKERTDLGNQMDIVKGQENGGSTEVNENSYRKRLRANVKKLSYDENSEEDEQVSVRKKRCRKGRNGTTVTGKEGSEIETANEIGNGNLAEGNGKEVSQGGRKKHNKEKNDGERESLMINSGIGNLSQQDAKEVKINEHSEEVSNLTCLVDC